MACPDVHAAQLDFRPARHPPDIQKRVSMQTITANGARIPAIGLGVMTLKEDVCIKAVDAALRMGYRHIDTAQMYGNEREVGEGLRASEIGRASCRERGGMAEVEGAV